MGRSLLDALPVLKSSGLQRTIDDAIAHQSPRTQVLFGVLSAAGARILQVRILPPVDTTTLIWLDVTEQKSAEFAVRRSEERLALAAEGASDGLWEWDLRSQEFYVSARWRAMMGLPATAAIGRLADWMDRVHPEEVASLKEALDAHLSGKTDHFQYEHRIRHESGTYRLFLCRGVAVRGAGRRATRIAGSLTDTTDRSLAREWVLSAGFLDPLTGLSNRSVFVERLGRRLEELKQRRGEGFAVLYIDLDRFKIVNDSLGHLIGDALLIAVSRRLESCLRPGDVLARLGGDEFAILLNGLGDETQANAIAFRIQHALSAPFSIGGPRGVHVGQHRHRLRPRRSTPTPTRSCATPTPRCITPRRAARRGTSCSMPTCTRARATAWVSRTTCAMPWTAATSRCTTSRSCR